MATVRQYDGDNAIERWRHCDDTTATVRYDYRIVAPASRMKYKISEESIDDVNFNFVESDEDDIDVVVKFDEALIKGKKARTTFHVYNTVNLFKELNSTLKMNTNNVTIIFKTFGIRGEQKCVYWNLSLNGEYGGWLTDGCASVRSDIAKITCVCNHLTHFAIIV
ncbi:hypothetical protein DPMN_144040, partial [Dreissena polymorpha]